MACESEVYKRQEVYRRVVSMRKNVEFRITCAIEGLAAEFG